MAGGRWILLGVGCAAGLLACAKGGTSVDVDDDGSSAAVGGAGGATVGPGSGGVGNTPGPGVGSGGMASSTTTTTTSTGSGGGGPTGSGGGSPGCSQILMDVGFEGGSPSTTWTESSTYLGTPLCDTGTCTLGSPRGGSWWFWGGGVAATSGSINEIAYVEQTLTIPTGTATVDYYIQIPSCDVGTDPINLIDLKDFFIIGVDDTVVYQTDTSIDTACGVTSYQMRSVDVSSYADGAAHKITFFVDILHDAVWSTDASSFWVDDVALNACP